MAGWRRAWHLATSDGVPSRAFFVALAVGTILNVINQGDALVTGAHINAFKLVLTFLVPYLVSTHGAVMARWNSAG